MLKFFLFVASLAMNQTGAAAENLFLLGASYLLGTLAMAWILYAWGNNVFKMLNLEITTPKVVSSSAPPPLPKKPVKPAAVSRPYSPVRNSSFKSAGPRPSPGHMEKDPILEKIMKKREGRF